MFFKGTYFEKKRQNALHPQAAFQFFFTPNDFYRFTFKIWQVHCDLTCPVRYLIPTSHLLGLDSELGFLSFVLPCNYISIRIKNVVKIMCLIEICRLSEKSVECDGTVQLNNALHRVCTSSIQAAQDSSVLLLCQLG